MIKSSCSSSSVETAGTVVVFQKTGQISNEYHKQNLLKTLNENRKDGLFCDFTIELENGSKFPVHRAVLAACPGYFQMYFGRHITDGVKSEKIDNFEIGETKTEIFESILEFIYTGQTSIELTNAFDLYEHAKSFSLVTLIETVSEEFLIHNINLETSLKYWRGSRLHQSYAFKMSNKLHSACFEFVMNNGLYFFEKYINQLEFDEIKELLKGIHLNCDEKKLYFYIIQWLLIDEKGRKAQFEILLKYLKPQSIQDESKYHLLLQNRNYQLNVIQPLIEHFHQKNETTEIPNYFLNEIDYPRYKGTSNLSLFAVCCNSIWNVSQLKSKIEFVKKFNNTLSYGFRATKFGYKSNYVLFSGGNSNSIFYYSPILNSIEKLKNPMLHLRTNHETIELNDKVYMMGGCNVGNTIEYLDLNSNKWFEGPKMTCGRKNFGISLHENGIYVFSEGTIEKFDPRENTWNTIKTSKLLKLDDICKSICIDNEIYCFGKKFVSTYDIRAENWAESTINSQQFYHPRKLGTPTKIDNNPTPFGVSTFSSNTAMHSQFVLSPNILNSDILAIDVHSFNDQHYVLFSAIAESDNHHPFSPSGWLSKSPQILTEYRHCISIFDHKRDKKVSNVMDFEDKFLSNQLTSFFQS